jgi:hypothetical protein
MNRAIVVIVIAAALGGVVAGGIMAWAFFTQRGEDAIATPVVGEFAPPPPPRKLIVVDAAELFLDGFGIGLPETDVAKTGRTRRLRFQKKKHDAGHVELWAIPKRSKRFSSVRMLVAGGEVVALRVKYNLPQPDTYDLWKDLLGKPYYLNGEERHWETAVLKAKARRDASKFYVVRKEYRGRFPW